MKTVAIIQARMSSSRLPGKVLKEASGRPLLDRMVERVRRSRLVDQVVVATTVDVTDDEIEAFCIARGIDFYRGSLPDVLDRYYQAAIKAGADLVVRLTGDCPLIDPLLIDETIQLLLDQEADFSCNRLPPPFSRTYPIGLDVEVCTFAALERAWKETTEKHEREHVLPYLYEVPGRFKVVQLNYGEDLGSLRWTLDTPQDLDFLRAIYDQLGGSNDFSWLDVLQVVRAHPELAKLNADVKHKTMFDTDKRFQEGS